MVILVLFAGCFFADIAYKHSFTKQQETNEPAQYQKFSENPLADVDPSLLTVDGESTTEDFARNTSLEPTTVNVLFCSG